MTAVSDPSQAVPEGLAIVVNELGTTTMISLAGEWDLAQQPATRDTIRRIVQRRPEAVVLDLSRLSFIDSSGLHVIIELHKRAQQENIRLVIVPGPRGVQRLFDICHLLEVLPFVGSTA